MSKHVPLLVACSVVLPFGLLIGLLAGAQFGSSSGVVALLAILLIGGYSRRVSAAKKLEEIQMTAPKAMAADAARARRSFPSS